MEESTTPILAHLDHHDPGEVVGVYLYGSAAAGGLRPDSDIDLLVLTRRSLTVAERTDLVSVLLSVSGWHGYAEQFPEAAGRRPIELTSIVVDDVTPLTDDPQRDFQYGEWLRPEFVNGEIPLAVPDHDVVTLIATAHTACIALRGPALGDVVAPVPRALLYRAVLASVPDVLADLEGDGRNVLLTLARMIVTLNSGRIVAKDDAVDLITPTLDDADRALLIRARDGYRGSADDELASVKSDVAALARRLADRAAHFRSAGRHRNRLGRSDRHET